MLYVLLSGAAGGCIRALLEPESLQGIGCKAGEWKGLLFNALAGLAAAWLIVQAPGREPSNILAFLAGYVVSDIVDSIVFILRRPGIKKHRGKENQQGHKKQRGCT